MFSFDIFFLFSPITYLAKENNRSQSVEEVGTAQTERAISRSRKGIIIQPILIYFFPLYIIDYWFHNAAP